MATKIPEICDYDCPHADFAPAQTAGICRTMSAIWCKKLEELVNKNMPCEYTRRTGRGEASTSTRSARKSANKSAKQSVKKKAKSSRGGTVRRAATTRKKSSRG